MDESVTNFMAITGCTNVDDARRLLLTYDNDLNRAIDRYFNQKNRDIVSKANGPSSSSAGPSGNSNRDVEVIEPMDTSEQPGPSRRRLPMRRPVTVRNTHPAPSAPDVNLLDDDEGIRRPIAPVSGQLVNESFQQTWRAGVSRPTNGVFHATTDFRELARQQEQRLCANRVNGGPPPNGLKPKTLQTLFQPPTEVLFIGPWEAARHQATMQNRWLLVNLQNNSEFACACLNRDIWNKESVQELVKKNFIFWQVADDSPDCKRVSSYYSVTSFPTVLIIDPRTGESVKAMTRLKDTFLFLEDLMEFLERYPDFAAYDQSFVQKRNKPGPSDDDIIIEEAAVNGVKKAKKRKNDDDEDSSNSKRVRISNSLPTSQQSAMDIDMNEEIDELCNKGTKLTTADREERKAFIGPEEPAPTDKDIITIRIRFPTGDQHQIRRFRMDESIKWLVAYCESLGYSMKTCRLFTSDVPKKDVATLDNNKSFRELKWPPREQIIIEEK